MESLQKSFMKFLQLESNKALLNQYSELYQQGDLKAIKELMLSHKEELESFFSIGLDKNRSSQQVEKYTTIGGTPHLDGEYTVFGKVIDGFDVIDKIAAEETSGQDKPLIPVLIQVSVKEMSKNEITKAYGYKYPIENE